MNEYTLRMWYDVFKDNKELVEIRILDPETKRSYSGYFTDIETILREIKRYEKCNLYFTLNVIDPACYSREQHDKISTRPKSTTSDNEILARKWCLIDIDCEKPSDTNSTDEEKEMAKQVVNNVYKFLRDEGFEKPIVCDSSNGYHLLYKQAMLSNAQNTETMKNFLKVLDMYFSTDKVKVDCSTFNPSRICKLYGAISRKGSDTKERPQRESKILKVPQEINATPNEYFEKVASYLPKPEVKDRSNNYGANSFDLDEFISKHGIKIRNIVESRDFTKYVLETCPFNSAHSAPDSAVFKMRDGSFGFKCLHNSDSQYTFKDFRQHFEPDAYNRKDYGEFKFKQKRYGQIEPFKPIEETEEKGKKWLSMSDVKRVDIAELLSIPTGYHELDRKIIGLFAGELTVLSGLNACVDCDTEYFNGAEWKKISEYTNGEKVLQYNNDGTAELVYPQRYIKTPCDTLHLMKTKFGVNQCVCDEHNIVYQTSKGNLAKKRMFDLITQHNNSKNGFSGRFYTTFKYSGVGVDLTDEQIRIMCAVICDGSFKNSFANKKMVRMNLKKRTKKERLERLLLDANILYRKEQYNPKDLEYNNYIFEAPRVEKEFGDFWYNCNAHQLEVIADEIMYWDGCVSHGSYSSTSKKNIDFIQFAFASCGKRTSIYVDNRVGKPHRDGKYIYKSIAYDLNVCSNNMVSMINTKNKTQIQDYQTKDGLKYCFTVPSGMLVLRREGNINITGNCGKTSWLNCLALNVIQKGFKVGIWSGEMQDWRFQGWLNQMAAGKNYVRKKEGYENFYYAPYNVCDKINEWVDGKLFLYNNAYGAKWEQLFSDIKELVENEGVQLIVLDNLAALCIDGYDSGTYANQTKFILDVKEYAKQKNIHVILVAHPRKQNDFLRKESISGTADLTNIADNVFLIHRVGNDFEKRAGEFFGEDKIQKYLEFSNVIEVAKNRQMGIVDHLVGMYYEVESRRLKNTIAEHVVYGWLEEPTQVTFDYHDDSRPFIAYSLDEAPF